MDRRIQPKGWLALARARRRAGPDPDPRKGFSGGEEAGRRWETPTADSEVPEGILATPRARVGKQPPGARRASPATDERGLQSDTTCVMRGPPRPTEMFTPTPEAQKRPSPGVWPLFLVL